MLEFHASVGHALHQVKGAELAVVRAAHSDAAWEEEKAAAIASARRKWETESLADLVASIDDLRRRASPSWWRAYLIS